VRHFPTILAVLLLFGCGTTGSTQINVVAAKFTAFDIKDERPLDQRASSKATEPYGEVSRLGDDAISPSGPELLKAWLGDKLGERLSGKKIVLTEFFVQVVDPKVAIDERRLGNAAASAPPVSGLFARWLIGGIDSVKSDKTVGVRIGGTVDGVDFSARGGGSFKGRVSAGNINSVITQALDSAVTDIGRLINEAPLPSSPSQAPVRRNAAE